MKKSIKAAMAIAFAGILATSLTGCDSSASSSSGNANVERLTFVTGGESGTYYAYGNVLGQFATQGDYGLNVTTLTSDGSKANIIAVEDGKADMGFTQSDVLSYAYDGTNIFEGHPSTDYSVVANVYQEQVQVVTCDESISSVDDLRGKTVSVGATNSGVFFNAVDILGAYGISLTEDGSNDFHPVYQTFAESAQSLIDGKIDAAFIVAGDPTAAITEIEASKQVYLISLDQEHIDKLLAENPYYSKSVILAGVYNTPTNVTTVSVGAVIIVSNELSEDTVYNLTKSLFDGKEKNSEAHSKYKALDIEEASSIVTVPYHPGAAKYYAEQGIDVGNVAE